MERITRGRLERKVKELARVGINVVLDRHQPGGAKFIWKPEDTKGHSLWNGRMTGRECEIFLAGMIAGEAAKDA